MKLTIMEELRQIIKKKYQTYYQHQMLMQKIY